MLGPIDCLYRRTAVVLLCCVLLGAAGCGEAAAVSTGPGAVSGGARPERIVPANSGAAELLVALIGTDRIAALPTTVQGYAASDMGYRGLPTFQRYNAENVLAFEPDLVVTHGWQNSDATSFLASRGVPVFVLPDLGDFAGLLATVEAIGERVHARDSAVSLRADLQARFDSLHEVDRSAIRLVSYTNFGSGGWTGGAETTANLLCELVGVRNLSAENGRQGHTNVDFETLLTWNPDVFLVGASGERPGYSPSAEMLRGEASLQSIDALKSGRVVVLPADLYTTNSQRIVDAAEVLASMLDELFP